MRANVSPVGCAPDALLTLLTDVAMGVVSRYGLKGPPDGHRPALRAALCRAVRDQAGAAAPAGAGAGGRQRLESLAVAAADAAYQVALGCGFRGSFLDLELELWKDLCQAVLHSPLAREFLRRAARSAAGREGQR